MAVEHVRAVPAGPAGYVSSGPVRLRLLELAAAGWTLLDIADHSGVDLPTLRTLSGTSGLVRTGLAAAVIAVGQSAVDGGEVCAIGTRRRLQALAALGWDPVPLAARAGLDWSVVQHAATVPAGAAVLVARTYDRLSMTRPPLTARSARVAAQAVRHRWAPPLSWDEDDLDDPDAETPPPWPPRRGLAATEVVELRELGLSDLEISARLGIQVAAVGRRVRRAAA